jgi:predicted DNA-binding protein YlxM (UPF0122 family)
MARGLCKRCYHLQGELKQRSHRTRTTRKLERRINLREIDYMYNVLNYSLNEIAEEFNCTRQYIYRIMMRRGIKVRDKGSARKLALEKGKLVLKSRDEFGIMKEVKLEQTKLNKKFFKRWTAGMAYVLGLLYTDGNLTSPRAGAQKKTLPSFSLSQKERELLDKALALMRCECKIHLTRRKGTGTTGKTLELYTFQIFNKEIYNDLLKLGLTPRKSRTIEFPRIPRTVIRHFLRGCWDGDGSVSLLKNNINKPVAKFVSGSKKFIEGISSTLETLGLPKRKIYISKDSNVFSIKYTGPQCVQLYEIFYSHVPETKYLERKYRKFRDIANHFSNH